MTATETKKTILFAIRDAGKLGFMDVEGNIVIPARFENPPPLYQVHHEGAVDFSDWVPVRYKKEWGYIDAKGAFLIEPRFGLAQPFFEDLAVVGEVLKYDRRGVPYGRWGYIDRTSQLAIPYRFSEAHKFSNGQAVVNAPYESEDPFVKGDCKVIDRTGAYVEKPKPGRCGSYLIGAEGKITLYPWWLDRPDGLRYVQKGEKYGFEDASGRLVVEPVYDEVDDFKEGLANVRVKDRWGFIDTQGRMVVEPQLLAGSKFSEGRAMAKVKVSVQVAGKTRSVTRVGFVNTQGEMVIEPRFTGVEGEISFQHGLAAVILDKARAYVDRDGKIVWQEKLAK